jgi:hypothetical protein
MTRNVINGWFSSSDMPTSVHYRGERDSLLCSLTLSTYPAVDSCDIFCLLQGTHFWCAGPYHKIHTYQMADKCSDSVAGHCQNMIKISLGGRNTKALVDSGAQISCIDERFLNATSFRNYQAKNATGYILHLF